MITCCILTCDKDFQYVKKCVESIIKNVPNCDEILIGDNREKNKSEPLNVEGIEKVKIIDMGGNKKIFHGRKALTEIAKNDYVWHGDCDDIFIGSVSENILKENFDVINGNVKTDKGRYFGNEILVDCICINQPNCITIHFGGKIIKKELLSKIFNEISTNERIIRCEDTLINKYLEYYSKYCYKTKTVFYRYNKRRNSWQTPWKRTKDIQIDMVRNIAGTKEIYKIDKQKGISEYKLCLSIAIENYFKCKKEDIDDILAAILETFDSKSILMYLASTDYKYRKKRIAKLLLALLEKNPELNVDFEEILSD